MEDDYFFTEKHSIRESARSLKKYGSTCNHVRNELLLIRHELEKTDTLQGIALKYGCTVSSFYLRIFMLFYFWRVYLRCRCFTVIINENIVDWANTSSQSSVRPRQPFFETVPDDTGGERFTILSERWSTTIATYWFIEQCVFARYANKFAKQSIDEGAQSRRRESQGYWWVYG